MALEDGLALGKSGKRANHALNGVLFLGGLELSYNVYGGTNSSPQTTDVFGGGDRSATLMKWVSIAGVKCAVYAVLASVIARSWWPFAGVAISATSMHALYMHADKSARKRQASGEAPPIPNSGNGASSTGRGSVRSSAAGYKG